jgi:hypothetical protein
MQDEIIKYCNCAFVILPTFMNISTIYCSGIKLVCARNIITNFGNSSANNLCRAYCPDECSSIDYEITTTRKDYPAFQYSNLLHNFIQNKDISLSYDYIPKSFTKLNVYYQNMKYKTTVEVPKMEIFDLFSSFGGTLIFHDFSLFYFFSSLFIN